jgi:hypothetical protein
MTDVSIYSRGLEWLCAAGVGETLGQRVCLKAILVGDGSSLVMGKTDATKHAVCHLVVDIGSEVTKVKPGDMVLHISTATDAADFDKVDGRYIFCHQDDIIRRWSHEEAVARFQELKPF